MTGVMKPWVKNPQHHVSCFQSIVRISVQVLVQVLTQTQTQNSLPNLEPQFRNLVETNIHRRFGQILDFLPPGHIDRVVKSLDRTLHLEEMRSLESIREGLETCEKLIADSTKNRERVPTMADAIASFASKTSQESQNVEVFGVVFRYLVRIAILRARTIVRCPFHTLDH